MPRNERILEAAKPYRGADGASLNTIVLAPRCKHIWSNLGSGKTVRPKDHSHSTSLAMLLSPPCERCHLLITSPSAPSSSSSYIILCESTSSEADAQMLRQAEGHRMSGRKEGREGSGGRKATANNIYPPTEPNPLLVNFLMVGLSYL